MFFFLQLGRFGPDVLQYHSSQEIISVEKQGTHHSAPLLHGGFLASQVFPGLEIGGLEIEQNLWMGMVNI